jgi:hypothetical protein
MQIPFIVTFIFCSTCWLSTIAMCAEDTIITDIRSWQHPTKEILKKYKISLSKVELKGECKYPVFYVKLPYDPQSSENDSYYNKLLLELLKAKGWWNYALDDVDDELIISVRWDKKKKTMHKEFVNKE